MDTTFTQTRQWFTSKSTVSELWLPGSTTRECFILEDVTRPPGAKKVWGQTAIPCGTYEVLMQYSPHFQRTMPHLQNVPGFTYVMIHWGNKPEDTDACLLTGTGMPTADFVNFSRKAFDLLLPKIEAAIADGRLLWKIMLGVPSTAAIGHAVTTKPQAAGFLA